MNHLGMQDQSTRYRGCRSFQGASSKSSTKTCTEMPDLYNIIVAVGAVKICEGFCLNLSRLQTGLSAWCSLEMDPMMLKRQDLTQIL